jgi:hypothetical protein
MHNHARAYRVTQHRTLARLAQADAPIGRAAVGSSLLEFLKAL